MGYYAPREYLKLLEPLGIYSSGTTKHLAYSEHAKVAAQEFVESLKRPIVGIAPGAGNKIKQWPPERFAKVAGYLVHDRGATVVVLGSARDAEEVNEMLANCKESVVNTLNRFSVDELKAVIDQLDLFISVDTGPIYIAEAFNVPTIDIVGPMDEREQPPQGEDHKMLVPLDRQRPELHIMNAKWYDENEAKRQARMITAQEVISAVNEML